MRNLNPIPQQLLYRLTAVDRSSSLPAHDALPDPALARLKELDLRAHLTRFEGFAFNDRGYSLCPFHRETEPSFEVKRHTDGHWYWFDWHCQGQDNFSGTIIDYYVKIKGMTVAEAIRIIRERANITEMTAPMRTDFQPSVIETLSPRDFLKTGAELQALEIRVDWTIDGLLPVGCLMLLYGASGIGKTWLALMIAKAISSGEPLFGLTTIRRPVVYVDYENPLSVLVDRVRKLNIRDVQFWHISSTTPPPKLDRDEWELYKLLPHGSVLIIDTSRSCHNMDENSSEAPALVMGRVRDLRELGYDIILLHHTTKADDQNAKGSSGWYDLADHTLSIRRVRNASEEVDGGNPITSAILSLCVGKKTRFAPPPSLFLTLDPDHGMVLAASPDAADVSALAEYMAGPGRGKNQSEIIRWARENGVGTRNRAAFIRLLNRYEGVRWRSRRGPRGSKLYEPIN